MNFRYSSKMVCNEATNAQVFRYSGGDGGVSKINSNGRGRVLGGALKTPS